jgi:hypothetical protein
MYKLYRPALFQYKFLPCCPLKLLLKCYMFKRQMRVWIGECGTRMRDYFKKKRTIQYSF